MSSPLRLFISIDLLDAARQFGELLSTLKPRFPSVRFTKAEQLHLTLKFLGDTDETLIEKIVLSLSVIKGYDIRELHLKGFGVFPNLRAPRVFWIGIEEPREALISLSREVDISLNKAIDTPLDKRPFAPHLTLGRFRGNSPINLHDLDIPDIKVAVSRMRLKRSTLTKEGAIHETLWEAAP